MFFSDDMPLEKAQGQGDLSPPSFFILASEVLGEMVGQNNNISGIAINGAVQVISLYLDETSLFLVRYERYPRECTYLLKCFQNILGLKLNVG